MVLFFVAVVRGAAAFAFALVFDVLYALVLVVHGNATFVEERIAMDTILPRAKQGGRFSLLRIGCVDVDVDVDVVFFVCYYYHYVCWLPFFTKSNIMTNDRL